MMNIKLNVAPVISAWATIKSIVNAAEDLIKWYSYAKQFVPMMKVPFVNLLISFKKVSVSAHKLADSTDTKIDDKVAEIFDTVMDGLLNFFHCRDDYEKMVALDE